MRSMTCAFWGGGDSLGTRPLLEGERDLGAGCCGVQDVRGPE